MSGGQHNTGSPNSPSSRSARHQDDGCRRPPTEEPVPAQHGEARTVRLRFHRPSSLMHQHGQAWQAAAPHPTRSGAEAWAEDGHSPQALTKERLPTKPLAEGEQLTCDHVKGTQAGWDAPGEDTRPSRKQGESWLYWHGKHPPPASCPAFLGRKKANRRPTSGCAVTSEAGLGPVTTWAGGQPQVRQERVALAQRLQLLALTQRGPCAVLGAQRGLGRCWAGTYTHTHTERDMPLEGAHSPARAQGEPWGLRTTF